MGPADLDVVYDLANDHARIEAIQRATLNTADFGLEPDPALFGTPEWWDAITRGQLPRVVTEGVIDHVYWGSMKDWPGFSLVDGEGNRTHWTREGDTTRYVEGLRARVSWVVMKHRGRNQEMSPESSVVLSVWLQKSRLRSSNLAPGPGDVALKGLDTLYRPVGGAELDLIEASGHRAFPPRLPEQPIFYPVVSEEYATKIARDWNTKDEASRFAGYVTRFYIRSAFLATYAKHEAGGRALQEYWIPAEELGEFNRNIVGSIEVIAEYLGVQGT